ncbi:MAG TPA: rRNA maturation RNase YbeY [Phycisphaerae bacterium]|nr:rRNA maturation RNase YbeY [Phycisphaerae bacterium]
MSRRSASPVVSVSSSQRAVRVPRKRIAELVAFVARAERAPAAQVDVAVVGAEEIASLNRRYLRHAGPTDVLSFDLSAPGDEELTAQVVVCGPVAVAEAAARHLRPQHELMLYVVHGLLHLLGHDDGTACDAERMHAREEELLGEFLAHCRRRRGGRT